MDARAKDGAIRNQVGMLAMSPIGLDEEQNATVDYFGTLKARMEGGGFEGSVFVPDNSHCLNAGGMGRIDCETETLVCFEANMSQQTPTVGDTYGTITRRTHASIAGGFGVRRLTPRECERLQGCPDDYTALDKAADGPRYKALGNSMAVPCIAFIGKRILAALERKNGNG